MIWEEVLVDRRLTRDEIADTVSKLFSVPSSDVLVVDDIAEVTTGRPVRILCERMPVSGDFWIRLSIYLRDCDLEDLDSKMAIRKFCDLLRCKCLMSDDSIDPLSWLLVSGSSGIEPVSLDAEQLEIEKYVVKKTSPGN
jgi:hypothetical protein